MLFIRKAGSTAAAFLLLGPLALSAQAPCSGWMASCAAVEVEAHADNLVVFVPNAVVRERTAMRTAPAEVVVADDSEASPNRPNREALRMDALASRLFDDASDLGLAGGSTPAADWSGPVDLRAADRDGRLAVYQGLYGVQCTPGDGVGCNDVTADWSGAATEAPSSRARRSGSASPTYFSFRVPGRFFGIEDRGGRRPAAANRFRPGQGEGGPPPNPGRPVGSDADNGSEGGRTGHPAGGGTAGGSSGSSHGDGNSGSNGSNGSNGNHGGANNGSNGGDRDSDTSHPGNTLPLPVNDQPTMSSVPEPVSTTLVTLGLLGYAGARARRRKEECVEVD